MNTEQSTAGHYTYDRLSSPLGYNEISKKVGLKTKIKILKGKWLLELTPDETNMLRKFKTTKHGLTAEQFAEKW
tara:strand:+ start:104 stop:325 length:222 start_codon:yes stop_codon:yes gene_type:complete